MRENLAALRQCALDALRDAVLMGCDEAQAKEAFLAEIRSLTSGFSSDRSHSFLATGRRPGAEVRPPGHPPSKGWICEPARLSIHGDWEANSSIATRATWCDWWLLRLIYVEHDRDNAPIPYWRLATLTLMTSSSLLPGAPAAAFSQRRICSQASFSVHRPISMISPVSSAMGMS